MKPRIHMSEAELQQHIVKLLEAYARPEIEWHHVPNGEERHPRTARRLRLMGVQRGVADLMFTIDGRAIAVELKTEIGTQSGAQYEWQERFERAGGAYFIAHGLDEALGVLNGIGAFRAKIINTAATFDGREVRKGERVASRSPNEFTSDSVARCRPGLSAAS